MHIYKASEWEGGSGRWYVNDVEDLVGQSGKWWIPMRILELTPTEYITLLKDKFAASNFNYSIEYNVLTFSFATQTEARKYKNWINKKAREKQFLV